MQYMYRCRSESGACTHANSYMPACVMSYSVQARSREAGLGRWGGGEPATGIRLVRQEPSILIGVVCDLTCLDFRQNTHKIRQARFGR